MNTHRSQNFVEINATGFRKILKKFDRHLKAVTKEVYLSSHVDVQPCFNNDVLGALADTAARHMTELHHSMIGLLKLAPFGNRSDLVESDILRAVGVRPTRSQRQGQLLTLSFS